MYQRARMSVVFIGLALLQTVARAESAGYEDSAPSIEQRLLADASDGELDDFTLLQAALIAGGVHDPVTVRHQIDEFQQTCRLIANEIRDSESREQTATVVFRLMYKFILTGQYQLHANSVAHTLATGEYNCLSAAILYQCLCDHFRLPVIPVALPGHVRNRFVTEYPFEIEPTCPQWLDTRSEQATSGQHAFEPATPITPVQLVERIYYNRATGHLQKREFAPAVDLLHVCTKLDPEHSAAHTNLLAAINNWVLALCEAQQFSAASRRLSEGLALAPDHEPFLTNDLYVHARWVRALCERGDYEQALAVLETAHRRRPDVTVFNRARFLIIDDWKKTVSRAGDSGNDARD